jgi:hypothetical protein
MKNAQRDTRIRCSHCHVATWRTDFVAFMRDHDRPDGRRCVAAAIQYAPEAPKANAA